MSAYDRFQPPYEPGTWDSNHWCDYIEPTPDASDYRNDETIFLDPKHDWEHFPGCVDCEGTLRYYGQYSGIDIYFCIACGQRHEQKRRSIGQA